MNAHLFFRASLGAVAVSLAMPALAQESKPADAESTGLQEIVVTAQKRAQDVQTIPFSIGVVTGEEISQKALNGLDDVLRSVPGVEVQGLAQGAQVYIRGVGSAIDPSLADPSIALMVDGVYNGRTESVTSGAYDIDRTEVLRGPQGTLYGRNASGGAVNVITANPRLGEFGGYLRGQVGNYSLWRGEGAINLPLGDNVALRVAGFREKRDGYIDDGSDDSDAYGFRAKLLFKPSDSLSVLLKADIYREKGHGPNTVPVPGSAGNLFFPPPFFTTNFNPPIANCGPSPFVGCAPILRFPNGWVQRKPGDPWSNNPEHVPGTISRKGETFSAQIDADLGFATLTVLPSYTRSRNGNISNYLFGSVLPGPDAAYAGGPAFPTAGGATYTVNAGYRGEASDTRYKSVEARLASNGSGALKYVLGLYYLNSDGGAGQGAQNLTTNTGGSVIFTQTSAPNKTIAGFGQVTYSVTDHFRVTGGLRFGNDKNAQSYTLVANAGTPIAVNYNKSQSSTQYKAGIEYDVAEQSMFYAHVASGFKQGGITSSPAGTPFDPEHLTSFEAGIKNRFLDNRLQLNLAAFHYQYKNYQFQYFGELPIGNSGATSNFLLIANAGASKITGAEAELDALPWKHGHIRTTLTWLDAQYGTAILPVNPFAGVGINLKDRQIQNSPRLAANLGFDQGMEIGSGMLTFSINTHLSKGYYTTPEQYLPGAYQKGYSRTDLSLRYNSAGDRFSIGVWLKNVENNAQTTYVFPAYRRFITSPRTFGVSAGVNF